MTIAVTAVSGHLGGAIARDLLTSAGGETIIGLARTPANAKDLGIEIRAGDYGQPEQLRASLKGIRRGIYDVRSDFEAVAGRAHQSWADYFGSLTG
jgi:uncharacterized protein YbjT (DUF2867 family)